MSQFSPEPGKLTLANYLQDLPKDIYPVGRLDYDSEGLLLLTNDKALTHQLLEPANGHRRAYYAQVEGEITPEALQRLARGVDIAIDGKTYRTRPAIAVALPEPILPERNPPIRFRKNVPTSWLQLTLTEGKNRQVRRMTAAVGFPTLRLVRYSIGRATIKGLAPGQWQECDASIRQLLLG